MSHSVVIVIMLQVRCWAEPRVRDMGDGNQGPHIAAILVLAASVAALGEYTSHGGTGYR